MAFSSSQCCDIVISHIDIPSYLCVAVKHKFLFLSDLFCFISFLKPCFPSVFSPSFLLHISKGIQYTRALLTSSRIPALGIKALLYKSECVCHLLPLCTCMSVQVHAT